MQKTVAMFINGIPGSGKDTLANLLNNIAPVTNISSITCIEELLQIPTTDKSPEARRTKAEVGRIMEEYNQFRSRYTAAAVLEAKENFVVNPDKQFKETHFIFVHAREQYVINRISDILRTEMDGIINIYVDRNDASTDFSNDSDKEAYKLLQEARDKAFFTYNQLELCDTFPHGTVIVPNNESINELYAKVKFIAEDTDMILSILKGKLPYGKVDRT